MKKIKITKMVAAGNDFVIVEAKNLSGEKNLNDFSRKICQRKYGLGGDGLLLLSKSRKADVRMRIFNADGSEAEMCGNGSRCAAFYSAGNKNQISLETRAGIIESRVSGDNVKIKLTLPREIKLDLALKLNGRSLRVNFINTGVPHTVIFTQGLANIDIAEFGRQVRNHKNFSPRGTNVNFVEVLGKNSIAVRTYERGVEDETLACGTGSSASALIFALKSKAASPVNVHTKSSEVLRVYFSKDKDNFNGVWLEGKVKAVYEGVYYV